VKQLKGELDGALADFNKAIALKPDSAEAHNNRGDLKWNPRRFRWRARPISKGRKKLKSDSDGRLHRFSLGGAKGQKAHKGPPPKTGGLRKTAAQKRAPKKKKGGEVF